ncbi:MAG: class I SAM-dependent RNA methyltransferase [Kiritimatiellae bacterium]|jgi:23S rRNA (uracil1939-C5)-methyltransferase|nr:class I SAM-dependent RNA methyltransferase [Kiritimatiellia bacterium]
MQTTDIITGRIEKVIYGGNGLIREDNFVIFVPGVAQGELVRAKITQLKKSYAIAELCEVLEPSQDRIEPNCRIPGPLKEAVRIPGCVYDHVSYDAEVAIKQDQLLEFIKYMPNAEDAEILPPFKSPSQLHYRNKLILHTSKGGTPKLGYQEERSHKVLDIPACPLTCAPINEKLHAIRSSDQLKNLPDNATVTIRYTKADGVIWWTNRPTGKSWLTEESSIGGLRVSSEGFYQTNPEVSQALTQTAAAWFKEQPSENILDLYCGVGLFGLACMKEGGSGSQLVGLESGKRAIIAAKHNATEMNIAANFQVRELGKKELNLKQYTKDPGQTTCIVDPPRAGMDKSITQTLAQSGIPRILYISCNPSTLQRDLKILAAEGNYKIKRIQLFDMFPRTAHFETIVEVIL